MNIEERIPAFSTWKVFSEIIPSLLNMDYSETTLQKLVNIVETKEFSSTFVYNHDPTLSLEEYQEISEMYMAFTAWFLGCFYYVLSCNKLENKHDFIIDAQWIIMDKMSVIQPNIYMKLCEEYVSALKQLNDYHRNLKEPTLQRTLLDAFKPQEYSNLQNKLDLSSLPIEITSKQSCSNLQKKTLKFLHRILSKNVRMGYFDVVTYSIMDCLYYILAECEFGLKLAVLDIYVDLFTTNTFDHKNKPDKFFKVFNNLTCLVENCVYAIYNIKNEILTIDFDMFEGFLSVLLENSQDIRIVNIARFISCKDTGSDLKRIAVNKACCIKTFMPPSVLLQNAQIKDCVAIFFESGSDHLLNISFKQVIYEIDVYWNKNNNVFEISSTWRQLYDELKNSLDENKCTTVTCRFFKNLLLIKQIIEEAICIKMTFKNRTHNLIFFHEYDILSCLISTINYHFETCCQECPSEVKKTIQIIFAMLPILYVAQDICLIFFFITHPFFKKLDLRKIILFRDEEFFRGAKICFAHLQTQHFSQEIAIQQACYLLNNVSNGLVLLKSKDERFTQMMAKYFAIVRNILGKIDRSFPNEVFKTLLYIPHEFKNSDEWISELFLPLLSNNNLSEDQIVILIEEMSDFMCKCTRQYVEVIHWDNGKKQITTRLYCKSCTYGLSALNNEEEILKHLQEKLQIFYKDDVLIAHVVYPPLSVDAHKLDLVLENVLRKFQNENDSIILTLIRALNTFTHVNSFYTSGVTKLWLNCLRDGNIEVKMALSREIKRVLESFNENPKLSKHLKENVVKMCFDELKELTKTSLQKSDFALQDVVLECLDQISVVGIENVMLHCSDLLFYFIMIPSSKYPLIAANTLNKMASQHDTTTKIVFQQHKKELSFRITQLCALNQAMVGFTLVTSLEKISPILGYFDPKDFVSQECRSLLPYFISLVTKMPAVEKLILEMANFREVDLANLLITRYGNIFLHSLLNETDEVFKKSVTYIEQNTGLSGNVLRRDNFQLILNELLLSFHEKQDRVLLALQILAKEDTEGQNVTLKQIPEYLQPKLFGVLVNFDLKLLTRQSDKRKLLLSLADLIRFMGPKHITPLRIKILAMLRTVLNSNFETFHELISDVWDAFVRNCEIDALGPQLATIFTSLLPLLQHFPQKIDDIFKYLIVQNEVFMKDYIPDLFFVVGMDINQEICLIIKNHLKHIENMPFKDQLKAFIKYLSHDTTDVRVYALKYITRLLEKNREELDRMVLGYNGIHASIVELLDILMLGCREKEETLKLACGECIGELGAIEPSHLPRRVTAEEKSFTFFITEDSFIVSALNELTRALQAENNINNMDRISFAIQEILKAHDISPEARNKGHRIWNSFPEPQRELMVPLLSSKYKMRHLVERVDASPIYGSKFGTTSQTWIYNWTCNLILELKSKKSSLEVMLPSLKEDHKILMHFLPYIVLHSLLDSNDDFRDKMFIEFMAVLNPLTNKQSNPAILSMQSHTSTYSIQSVITKEVKENKCIKVIFVLIDFLDRWIREWMWKRDNSTSDASYCTIKAFLQRFSKLQLAQCNYKCGEYPRALMYLEEHIKDNPGDLQNHFNFLARLYAQLDEPDGVAGVTALQDIEPSLEQRILALEVAGKLADAAACYERLQPPHKPYHLQGLVQCYLDLDNVNTALNFTKGAVYKYPDYETILLEMQTEPLWRLGSYDELDILLKKPELTNNNSWGLQIGRALLHLRNGERDLFQSTVNSLRNAQVDSLGAGSLQEGVYQHGYSYVTRLHVINELQNVEKIIYELLARSNDHKVSESLLNQLSSEWDLRLKVVQVSHRTQEFILCLRRVVIEQAKQILETKVPHSVPLLNSLLGKLWLCSAKTARKLGIHQQGYTYTLKAEEYAPSKLFVEKAKLHWSREEHEQALATLRRGLELLPNPVNSNLQEKKIVASAKLLIASYNDSISNVDTDTNTQNYKDAVDVFSEWEKSMVYMAQYYDRLFQTFSDAEKDTKGTDIQICIISYFGTSLQYGSNYVYQSLPRMLSVWFDYGTRLLEVTSPAIRESRTKTLLHLTRIIDKFSNRVPAYIFLTAFSQLVSRICHPDKHVHKELASIITQLLLKYPQHTLWMMMSVIKSSYQVRSRRCAEILNDVALKTPNMLKLVGDFTKLAEKLIELCNKEIPDTIQVTSVYTLLRGLPRLLDKDFSEIMIPIQKFRKLILPNPDFNSNEHNPFPNHYVHIAGIEDEIVILQSLQRPRKITFRGSDGKRYIQMLKAKDDLRKDFRLMEFNDVVNQLLSRDSESRQRRLNIRLYSVVPLNEECGLIEWVPNLVGLRPILNNLYSQIGQGMRNRELKNLCSNIKDSLNKKRDIFTKVLLVKHPPILGEWFRKAFPDAQTWFTARTAYIRTTAVISIVGYILGLGDRHGENILLDSTCGDTVHVDFNCLFNKGETFEWPERVPFRLTHNMVAAMGPLGVEGIFRKSCACTLRVLRSNINTFMCIVTPFVYDPLVSWPHISTNAERTNNQAVEHVRNIQLRLQGTVRTKGRSTFSMPLSVEGQTNNLIQEALSIDNLCQMYFGWGAYY